MFSFLESADIANLWVIYGGEYYNVGDDPNSFFDAGRGKIRLKRASSLRDLEKRFLITRKKSIEDLLHEKIKRVQKLSDLKSRIQFYFRNQIKDHDSNSIQITYELHEQTGSLIDRVVGDDSSFRTMVSHDYLVHRGEVSALVPESTLPKLTIKGKTFSLDNKCSYKNMRDAHETHVIKALKNTKAPLYSDSEKVALENNISLTIDNCGDAWHFTLNLKPFAYQRNGSYYYFEGTAIHYDVQITGNKANFRGKPFMLPGYSHMLVWKHGEICFNSDKRFASKEILWGNDKFYPDLDSLAEDVAFLASESVKNIHAGYGLATPVHDINQFRTTPKNSIRGVRIYE